jgi:hypothetical protein
MHGCRTRLATFVTAAVLAAPASAVASPPSVPSPFPAVSGGQVDTILVDGDTAYLGGSFDAVGRPAGPMSVLSRATGQLVRGYTEVAGNSSSSQWQPQVSAIEPDGAGGWYAGGVFESAADVEHHSVIHVRADGSIDHGFQMSTNGWVEALALHGDMLWVGGDFNRASGLERSNLAAVDARSGAVLPPAPHAGDVLALDVAGDRLYVGGRLGQIETRGLIAAHDADTGALLPWEADTSGNTVTAIEATGDTVYIAGNFDGAGGSGPSAAALRASDGAGQPVNFHLDAYADVSELVVTDDTVVLGGRFPTGDDDHPYRALAAFDRETLAQHPMFADVYGGTSAMARAGDTLYVEGVAPDDFGAFDLSTGARLTWGAGPKVGSVNDLAVIGDRIVTAGMLLFEPVERRGAAAVDLRTGAILPWNPDAGGAVKAIVKHGDALILGGSFMFVGQQVQRNLAAVDAATGALRPDTVPQAYGAGVRALAIDGSTLYVGGNYYGLDDQNRRGLGAVSLVDGSVLPWGPQLDCAADTLAISAGTLHVGGCFSYVDGQLTKNLASFDMATGTRSTTFTAQASSDVTALAPDGAGGVWVGGAFSALGGHPHERLGHLDATGADDPSVPAVEGQAWTIVPVGNEVYVGGVSRIGGVARRGIAAFDATTGAVAAFDPSLDGSAFAIAPLPGDGLLVGGGFTTTRWRSGWNLARFGGEPAGGDEPGGGGGEPGGGDEPGGGGEPSGGGSAGPIARPHGAAAAPTPSPAMRVRIVRDPARRMLRRGVRVRVLAPAGGRVRVELRAGRRVAGRRATTIAPGRWRTVRVRVRRLGRLRAIVRDAATATVLARSATLRARR